MSATPQFVPTNNTQWTNRHDTFTQQIENLYDCINSDMGTVLEDYNKMTKAIQEMMSKALERHKRMKVLGGGWSFTKIATTEGWMFDSKQMNLCFPITAGSINSNYKGAKGQLFFAQCGVSVKELNEVLREKKRSLKTSGASNGQTIVGAISTATHGAAIDFGATQDFVVGLHIILSPDKHIWLERKSYPVVSKNFLNKIGAELRNIDDDEFNSAIVSFGSFGFIHGVMIETEPLYLLETFRRRVPLNDLKNLLNTLDFTNLTYAPHNERPFHFQWVINPYDVDAGVYVTFMYKRPYREDYVPSLPDPNKAGPGDDLPMVIGKMTELFPSITPTVVTLVFKASYTPFENEWGTLGEIFYNSDMRGKVASAAIAIPADKVWQFNELLMELNEIHGPFGGVFSYRYIKGSKATLGFGIFEQTCVVELDAVKAPATLAFYKVVWDALIEKGIPHTFHWGKMNNLTAAVIKKMYGTRVDKWLKARKSILPPDSIKLFNNETLEAWGLDAIS